MSDSEVAALKRILERERRARKAAEKFLEAKSQELFRANKDLTALTNDLEQRVKDRTEELDKALVDAEAAAEAKSIFLANMSHEIRTPLNGVLGMTNLLLDDALSDNQHHFVEAIRESAELLLVIINDILDFSKIEAGKLDVEITEFSIVDVVDSLSNLLQIRAHNKDIGFHVVYDSDLPHTLLGDPSRLRQILLNLLDNAIKFTPAGSVVFRIKRLKAEDGSVTIRFEIIDTGIGMTDETLLKLFQPFNQAEKSTSRRFGGTGLGLAIAKKLTQAMGGDVRVKSELSKGTTFSVVIAFAVPEGESDKPCLFSGNTASFYLTVDDWRQKESLVSMLELEGISNPEFVSIEEARSFALQFDSAAKAIWIIACDQSDQQSIMRLAACLAEAPKNLVLLVFVQTQKSFLTSHLGGIETLSLPINRRSLNRKIMSVLGLEFNMDEFLALKDEPLETEVLEHKHILLAEDNLINQIVCREMLTRLGAHVDIAANGFEVLQMLELFPYDLILMDIRMPEMGGIEACKKIRSQGNDIPIIALTANAMKGDREAYLEAGMNDYLSKPLKKGSLIKAIINQSSAKETDPSNSDMESSSNNVMDIDILLDTLGGNRAMAEEIIDEFCCQCDDLVQRGVEALERKDWPAASSIFHRFAGSAFAIRAEESAYAAIAIETLLGKEPVNEDQLGEILDAFKAAINRFESFAVKQGWKEES